MARRWLVAAIALVASAYSIRAAAGPFEPAQPATPLPRGAAADPKETLDEASPTRPVEAYPPARDASPGALSKDEKRPAPRRESPSPAWWIPRVVLAPLYFVTEYGIRWPLGTLVNHAERHAWPQKFLYYASFGTFGTEHQILLLPAIDFEWGVRANGGLALSMKNVFTHGNDVYARATAGGPDWLRGSVSDRLALSERSAFTLSGEAGRRADLRFHGLGPSSPEEGRYFHFNHAYAGIDYENRFWRSSVIEAGSGFRAGGFDREIAGLDGYVLGYNRVRAAIDTRAPRHLDSSETVSDFVSPPGTGIRVEGRAEHDAAPMRGWLRYGGGVGGYLDVNGQQRTIGLAVTTELVSPLDDRAREAIPFTELATLGGPEPFRAFRTYRFVDRSYVAAKASYRWPVWASLDGALDATFGNVFGPAYEGFAPRLLRGAFTVGLETTAARDQALQLLIGIGTRTFEDGFGIESVRVVAGTSRHF